VYQPQLPRRRRYQSLQLLEEQSGVQPPLRLLIEHAPRQKESEDPVSSNRRSPTPKAKVILGIGLTAAVALAAVVITGKRASVLDPLKGEPGMAVVSAATPPDDKDFSEKRWQKRARESLPSQIAASEARVAAARANAANGDGPSGSGVGGPGDAQRGANAATPDGAVHGSAV